MTTPAKKNDGKYNCKANTICILKILESYSNGDIILPMSRIIELMDTVYNLHVQRQTVYSSIDILQKLGYSIETYEDNGIGYALTNRPFDTLEIKLLIDSLRLNSIIPRKVESAIVDKLMKFVPANDRTHIMERLVAVLKKEPDLTLFYNLDTVDLAFHLHKKIEFDYQFEASSVHYILTPMTITYLGRQYCVVCSNPDKKQNIFFNLKDLKNLSISEEDAGEYTYFKGYSELDTLNVNTIKATFSCSSDIEGIFKDTFSAFDIYKITQSDNARFTAKVTAPKESIIRFALAYIDKCQIVEPEYIREEIKAKIKAFV